MVLVDINGQLVKYMMETLNIIELKEMGKWFITIKHKNYKKVNGRIINQMDMEYINIY